ncbi:Biosynthetic arginine decarboxylase [Planctomycetes bacterium CA13]|uniref:Biosynthetic arginine decarboxylase n=1 Tax=Novipirellula herctigrandis TaxID=2527986 RepID=A0A5C5YWL4_9BACT|nr:Biosynthetic arginine decarboxylase [Planctomycetes bacterium CA13]
MSIVEQKQWNADDSASLYEVDRWGDGYFFVSEQGRLVVAPSRDSSETIDLKQLVDGLTQRGVDLPILLRFNGILRDRLKRLSEAFGTAIEEHGYKNRYRCVYPIKVNQQRDVVAQFVHHGRNFGFGVEAGSKPEMLAVVAMTDSETPIICNGFKDDDFIHLAMRAQQIGRTVIPVVEKVSDLDLILKHSQALGVRPTIGMRVKLATRGSGRWQASGGYRSKFGLTVAEMLRQLQKLEERGMADCFKLLHFHVGSQITHIRQLKSAILEAARIYVDLHRRGAGLEMLDVGGGLGVDYDGSHSDNDSSMNYSMLEYAKDVVYLVQTVCDEAEVPHPELISESGRAIAAHHSVLIVNTLGVTQQGSVQDLPTEVPDTFEQPVIDLWMTYNSLTSENMLESFHDSQTSLDLAMNLFSGGYLPLEQRVVAENLYFAICHRVREFSAAMEYVPDDVTHLNRVLSDIYFANFSLFQSVPDSWAIDQLFPVMPIHRLHEQPMRHAVIGDITCDSDGKIDRFVSTEGVQRTLMLHHLNGAEPYQLGIFMVGAYQEILGDLHNLFGDTHAVHVDMEEGSVTIGSVVKGDTVSEVLGYVQYDDRELSRRWLEAIESAVRRGLIDNTQAGEMIRFYERSLESYTYLSEAGNSVSKV